MTEPTPFPHVFRPLRLRHATLRNRIVFGAHTANMSEEGRPGARHLAYYRERARGGAAMIVVEPTPAHRTGVLTRGNFRASDETVPAFRAITEACRAEGAVMIHQIYHVGGHGDQDNSWEPYWSPSGRPSFHDPWGGHAMTGAEIEEVIEGFVACARRDQAAGFDGVDLFAGYNCLIDQFWSPLTNRRDDRWGGALENRLRFTVEIIERIRKAVGQDFVIGMTISGAEPYPGGLTLADKQEIAAWLDARGLVDYFSVGAGSYLNQFAKIVPAHLYPMLLGRDDAAAFKSVVKHAAVTMEARVKTPANAEDVLGRGLSDLVSIVRGQIADPHLVAKAREDRADDIRPCISCNQLCLGRRMRDYWISCLVNPSVGREHEWGGDASGRAETPKQVLVVGGGPAGLEAARVAAERGHRVRLVEQSAELGGQFRLAAGQPERGEIGAYLGWAERQLEKLQVTVERRRTLDAEAIAASGADAVILATGSTPSGAGYQRALPHVDRLPGADAASVTTAHAVLAGEVTPGADVLLLDDINGWWPASGTAIHLALKRHRVVVVTAAEKAAAQLDYSSTGEGVRERFMKLGVEVLTASALTAWADGLATIVNLYTGDTEERRFDTLVLATTNDRDDRLERALERLEAKGFALSVIGDAVQARTASMAIYEARKAARAI